MKQKTVVITGASSGIGMEFARAFSKMGCRLILTARRKERLEKLREELGTPCKIIVADLSREGECYQFFENIADEPVDVFINNAGFGTCGKFDETDLGKEVSMINVNIKAMHILFKKMVIKMKKQGYGRILNVASSAGLLPAGPYMTTYYATKSYVVSITKAVAEELKEQGSNIYVGALCPGPVDTEFNENADMYYARCERVDDLLEAAKRDRICKIAIFDTEDAQINTYMHVKHLNDSFKVSLSGHQWVDIMYPTVNKGEAMRLIQKKYNISYDETMAFGDYLNDYEKMQTCYYSYAMENAHEDLKKVARFITKSNDESGVVHAINSILG